MAEWGFGAGAASEGVRADDLAGADDAGVVGVEGVDEGGVAGDPATLPADLRDRVVVHVGGAGEDGVGCEAEEGAGAELDCSGEVVARGDEDFAAAEDRTTVDGLLDGGGVFGGAIAEGAIVPDVEDEGGFDGGRGLGLGSGLGFWLFCLWFCEGEGAEDGSSGDGLEGLSKEAAACGEAGGGSVRHAFLLSGAISRYTFAVVERRKMRATELTNSL